MASSAAVLCAGWINQFIIPGLPRPQRKFATEPCQEPSWKALIHSRCNLWEKGEPNLLKLLGVQTFSVASYMKLYNAAPPDRILTYFPEVTACRGRDLAPRVKQSPTKWRLTEVAHDQIQSFISKTRPCSGLRAIKDHRRRKIDTIYGPLRIHARRYEECSCGQPNAPFRVAGFFRIARPPNCGTCRPSLAVNTPINKPPIFSTSSYL
jgi:hypothetical protein